MSIGTKVLFTYRGVLTIGRVQSVRGARVVVRFETRGGLTEERTLSASEVAS